MNKKVQTIVDIIGTDGKKKVKAAWSIAAARPVYTGPQSHISWG